MHGCNKKIAKKTFLFLVRFLVRFNVSLTKLTYAFLSECNNLRLGSTFRIQPTMSQFKTVQDFVERCHWNYHFFCFRMLYLSYMENIPAHRDLFHFIEMLQLMHILSRRS